MSTVPSGTLVVTDIVLVQGPQLITAWHHATDPGVFPMSRRPPSTATFPDLL